MFNAQGEFVIAMPLLIRETRLTSADLAVMSRLPSSSRYDPAARLSDHFLVVPDSGPEGEPRLPLLSALIPIKAPGGTNLLAVAELVQDGAGIARELAALDQQLTRQAVAAFAVSGAIVALTLGAAFWRMRKITARVEQHAAELRRANQELALVAKTSALGAVTAHLLHGLSSPLTGLQHFMAAHAADDEEWQDALRGTQRMQALVSECARLMGEQTNGVSYALPIEELARLFADKARSAAEAAGVGFEFQLSAEGALANRNANLVLLILENLLQNAVQAAPGQDRTPRYSPSRAWRRVRSGGRGAGFALRRASKPLLALSLDQARRQRHRPGIEPAPGPACGGATRLETEHGSRVRVRPDSARGDGRSL